jgi:hypothetical protein
MLKLRKKKKNKGEKRLLMPNRGPPRNEGIAETIQTTS